MSANLESFQEDDVKKCLLRMWIQPPDSHKLKSERIKFHCCYILESLSKRGKTYIGYSVNPFHRLRQHNGEISGGAYKTRKHRPWRLICYIAGFATQHEALQFEWRLQHPFKGLHKKKSKKTYPGIFLPGHEVTLKAGRSVAGILYRLSQSSCLKKWTNNAIDSNLRPLSVYFIQHEYKLPFMSPNLCVEYV